MHTFSYLGALLLCSVVIGVAQTPEWLWHRSADPQPKAGETAFFRKEFSIGFPPREATLLASGDDEITVYINGVEVAKSDDWREPVRMELPAVLLEGRNLLALKVRNRTDSPAGGVIKLEVRSPNNSAMFIVTEKTWISSDREEAGWEKPRFDTKGWRPAVTLGAVPVQPWGDVFGEPSATAATDLTALPGFKVDLIRSAKVNEGSWICMTFDDKGRIILSPERTERPLLRVELTKEGQVKRVEAIPAPMRAAMGLAYAHESLYVNGHGPKGVGLYRLKDSNGNDQFDPGEEQLLKNFEGDNEHGYHAVVPGPDGMIYIINGNMTKVPAGMSAASPLQNYQEDLLLPRQWDPTGHARGILAPGGHVMRTDPEGKEWSLFCGGFRNAYDIDFNEQGELFTFDSDMEYDIGTPWYRPTRVFHCVSGADFGWRSGSGKWRDYYPDTLSSVVDVGLSSPTGVKFGSRSNYPDKYRSAFFIADWNYGRILAVHLRPDGASYKGNFELFVSGKPLPVVDLEFGPDGAMYFITGGWRTQSGLYRVSYTGEQTKPEIFPGRSSTESSLAAAALRRKLESLHTSKDRNSIAMIWPHLSSDDRFIRYAARVALENQDTSGWAGRALEEQNPTASLAALLALARRGEAALQSPLIESLYRTSQSELSEGQKLEALRVLQVALIRMGRPEPQLGGRVADYLLTFFPTESGSLNEEICAILVYLQDARVIPGALARMKSAPTQQEQMFHAFSLRNLTNGWTGEQRRAWLEWNQFALAKYEGGVSFARYIENSRAEVVNRLEPSVRKEIEPLLARTVIPEAAPKVRDFVREWTFEELTPLLSGAVQARSISSGREAYATQCLACHRMGQKGGAVGPDLTSVASRFSRRELLEHIIEPSKVISDRFQSLTVITKDDDEFTGIILEETEDKLVLQVNPLAPDTATISLADIKERHNSKVSMMPQGLLNSLTKEEILDLLAFLEVGAHLTQ